VSLQANHTHFESSYQRLRTGTSLLY